MQASQPASNITSPCEQQKPLLLPPNVYICIAQRHVVFSDFNTDEYSAEPLDGDTHQDLMNALEHRRDEFLGAGLLTTDETQGRPLQPTQPQEIQGHILGLDDKRIFGLTGEHARDLRTSWLDLFDFLLASWLASRELKSRTMLQIVERVRKRKLRASGQVTRADALIRLTALYGRLRPWYPRKYLCLYDSLALVEFLARHKLFPTWVFAVQVQPFSAHCWVQHEGKLLNEGTEFAGQFCPIALI